jgi:histidinol phosphatase-like PHP family hydrolase
MRILSAAKACGCKFHFGSDSHRVKMFVGTHEKLLLAAKKIGITKNDVWDI